MSSRPIIGMDVMANIIKGTIPVDFEEDRNEFGIPYDHIHLDMSRGEVIFTYKDEDIAKMELGNVGPADVIVLSGLRGVLEMRVEPS